MVNTCSERSVYPLVGQDFFKVHDKTHGESWIRWKVAGLQLVHPAGINIASSMAYQGHLKLTNVVFLESNSKSFIFHD